MSARRLDRTRLGNLCGMIGSSGDGEALNAARLADRMVRQAGMTWHDVLAPAGDPQHGEVPDHDDDFAVIGRWPGGFRRLASDCARNGAGVLSEWEIGFCRSCATIRCPSKKQAGILRKLADRLMLEGRFS